MITGYRIHFLLFTAIIFFFSCDEILDIFPPEIELLSPTEDILTADTVTFLADASDNIGIERVAFKLRDPVSGNNVKNTIYSTPYQLELVDVQTWNQIELEVIAYDDVGNFKPLFKTFLIQSTVENASITVTAPNGGETWETGETATIRWTSVDVPGNIDIELYKGSSFLETIVDDTDNDGTYNWDIPGSLESATDYRIKISWVDYTSVYDYSDGSFAINHNQPPEQSITINSPSSGAIWYMSTTAEITWTDNVSLGLYHYLHIDLYRGSNYIQRITSNTTNDGSYNWHISSSLDEANDYNIKIVRAASGAVYDQSGTFSIEEQESSANIAVLDVSVSPTSVSAGGTVDVSFSVSNSGSSNITNTGVDIFLSTSSSSYSSGTLLFEGSFPSGIAPGSSGWEADDVTISSSQSAGTYYLFVVIDYSDGNQSDNYASALLTVTSGGSGSCPTLTATTATGSVTSPAANSTVSAGTGVTINWTFQNGGFTPGQCHIVLYEENDPVGTIQSWAINDGSFTWNVSSSLPSSNCYNIRILHTSYSDVYVVGPYFTIQ